MKYVDLMFINPNNEEAEVKKEVSKTINKVAKGLINAQTKHGQRVKLDTLQIACTYDEYRKMIAIEGSIDTEPRTNER